MNARWRPLANKHRPRDINELVCNRVGILRTGSRASCTSRLVHLFWSGLRPLSSGPPTGSIGTKGESKPSSTKTANRRPIRHAPCSAWVYLWRAFVWATGEKWSPRPHDRWASPGVIICSALRSYRLVTATRIERVELTRSCPVRGQRVPRSLVVHRRGSQPMCCSSGGHWLLRCAGALDGRKVRHERPIGQRDRRGGLQGPFRHRGLPDQATASSSTATPPATPRPSPSTTSK